MFVHAGVPYVALDFDNAPDCGGNLLVMARQVQTALAWVYRNTGKFGGDPDRIFLFGHSAGANHVADFVQHPDHQGPAAASVKGAILLSPNYEAAPTEAHVYYGADLPLRTAGRTIERLGKSSTPIFLAYAEYDPPTFKAYAPTLREGLEKSGHKPGFVYLKDHGHISEGLASVYLKFKQLKVPAELRVVGAQAKAVAAPGINVF